MRIAKIIGLAALALACPIIAAPIIGGEIHVVKDGAVQATFLAGYGAYSDDLLLYLPTNGIGIIFNNQTTPVGTVFNLGNYTAGTELTFQIHVLNTHSDWFSGDAFRNADGMAHNMVINDWAPGLTLVGFEDLVNGGDEDYDDLAFSLTNAHGSAAVPEPAGIALFGLGLAGLGIAFRRRKA